MGYAQPQEVSGPDVVALMDALTRQLSHRQNNDETRFIAFQTATDARFRTLHEDGRRDRREMLERLDKIAGEFRADMKAGFQAVETRLADVCDKGGREHAEFRSNDEALAGALAAVVKRMDEAHVAATTRIGMLKVAGTALSAAFTHGWKVLLAAASAVTLAQHYLPQDPAPTYHAVDYPLALRD